jgi:hypothetical protein
MFISIEIGKLNKRDHADEEQQDESDEKNERFTNSHVLPVMCRYISVYIIMLRIHDNSVR